MCTSSVKAKFVNVGDALDLFGSLFIVEENLSGFVDFVQGIVRFKVKSPSSSGKEMIVTFKRNQYVNVRGMDI